MDYLLGDKEYCPVNLYELSVLTKVNGEPKQISGKQELYESIINQYIK